MSMHYRRYLRRAVRDGAKRATAASAASLVEAARAAEGHFEFTLPRDGKGFAYSDHPVARSGAEDTGGADGPEGGQASADHCLVMRNKRAKGDHALLFLHGGWMLQHPLQGTVGRARNIGTATQRDVWLPYYPLCTQRSVLDAARMVLEVYEHMLQHYQPQDISFYGFEVGGLLALTVLGLNNLRPSGQRLPMPNLVVAVSPSGCSADENEQSRMKRLDASDVFVDSSMGRTLRTIMNGPKPHDSDDARAHAGNRAAHKVTGRGSRADIPEFLFSGKGLDCTGFPDVWIYYGTNECMSAKARLFEDLFDRAGIYYRINLCQGMCHCYCTDLWFPEAREDYEEILRILSWDGQTTPR